MNNQEEIVVMSQEVIKTFFERVELQDAKNVLQEMFSDYITQDNYVMKSKQQRSHIVFTFNEVLNLLDGIKDK